MKLIAYIMKTLWGHRARTMLTVAGSAVALFVFCFIQSIQEGMNDLKQRQEARGSLIVFQANKFCPATSHLPQDYDQQISKFAGVKDVIPIQVFTNNCRASLDVVVFYGVPPKKLRSARDFQFISGNWNEFETHQDAAIVGQSVANRRKIKVGDKFSIGDLSVNVAGIYRSENPAEENYIYSHLEFLQRRQGANLVGTVTQLEVILVPGTDPMQVSTAIDERYRKGPVETNTRAKGVFQAKSLGDLSQLIEMAHYLGLACVGLVLALVATTTLMSVEDRIQEHAVLRTLGFSGFKVFTLVLAESTFLSVAGGTLGVGTALVVLKLSSLSVGAEAVTVAFIPSLHLAWVGMLLACVTGICAGIIPASYASRAEIVPALRNV
ncbi:MAG: ABC transporter substrate-binding protein [Gimesia sp.]|jgi:putative ABC transport system permease protein|uniref:ABC transporter substrate-binding protein n=1 Tax=Gimesia maris TaxID=122 RepID=A0A3D3RFH9_9PLAN|nr:ABC transporter substrate-binding protein [Gimesia sp.]HCO26787.1 ABC transporter substrate-binding protein [Gimesia maris]|tara:strand:- start:34146 stop:35285 length:1140 start_codon:yes stop_codon:yes gene_type:complete